MNVPIPESRFKRMAAAVGAAVVVMVVAGLIYLLMPAETSSVTIDGRKIVAAGTAYTKVLIAHKQPIPKTVSLNGLMTHGYLKPADVAPFQGLDAELVLMTDASNPQSVLMRVHMPDDTDLLLLGDGSTQQVPRQH
jgi:hypothetical protein